MGDSVQIQFRVSPDCRDALDGIASQRGTTRSEVLRALVTHELDPPDRMTLTEALDLLDAKARAGSTQAIVRIVDRLLNEQQATKHDPHADFGLRAVS